MNKFHRTFNWLLVTYCAALVLYLFNLAAPPKNLPIFIAMVILAAAALIFSRNRKRTGVALAMLVGGLLLIVKEYNDGVALKARLEKARQQSQQLDASRQENKP